MADSGDNASSNADLEEPGDEHNAEGARGAGNRPAGGEKAAHAGAVGQHPDEMRKRGTVDPDKPDPSGGAPG